MNLISAASSCQCWGEDIYMRFTIGTDGPAPQCLGMEHLDKVALPIENDDTAIAALCFELGVNDKVCRLVDCLMEVSVAKIQTGPKLDLLLTVSGENGELRSMLLPALPLR